MIFVKCNESQRTRKSMRRDYDQSSERDCIQCYHPAFILELVLQAIHQPGRYCNMT